jgi:WD40 repeat protein
VVAFSKDSNTLVSGSKQDPIRVWKKKYPDKGIYGGPPLSTDGRGAYNDWSHAYSLWGHELPISAITAREDGLLIASGDTGGNIKTWQFYERWVTREGGSYRTGQWLYTSASTAVGPDFSINTLALSPNDTSRLVFSLTSHRKHTTVTCRDRTVGLIEIQRMWKPSGEYCEKHTHRLSTMWGHEYGVTAVDFHPTDANLVASLDRRGILKIWDISTVERPVSLETGYWTPATFKVFRVAIETNEGVVKFSPDGAWITTASVRMGRGLPQHSRTICAPLRPRYILHQDTTNR